MTKPKTTEQPAKNMTPQPAPTVATTRNADLLRQRASMAADMRDIVSGCIKEHISENVSRVRQADADD